MFSIFTDKKFDSAQKLFEESKEFEASGDLQKALSYVEKAQALQPQNPILKVKHFELEEKIKGNADPLKPFRATNSDD